MKRKALGFRATSLGVRCPKQVTWIWCLGSCDVVRLSSDGLLGLYKHMYAAELAARSVAWATVDAKNGKVYNFEWDAARFYNLPIARKSSRQVDGASRVNGQTCSTSAQRMLQQLAQNLESSGFASSESLSALSYHRAAQHQSGHPHILQTSEWWQCDSVASGSFGPFGLLALEGFNARPEAEGK